MWRRQDNCTCQIDYAEDKRINKKIYDGMSEKQKAFFLSLGVDIMKVRAEETVHADPGEGAGRTAVRRIDFLFCGRFLMLPNTREGFTAMRKPSGENFPGTLKIVPMTEGERIPVFDIDGLPCIFKHRVRCPMGRSLRNGTAVIS